jgi:glycolate oxidase
MEFIKIKDHSGLEIETNQYFNPTNKAELIDFIKANPTKKFRIGAGLTGVSGGAIPVENELYLNVSQLNKIKWKDITTGILEVECGVRMDEIQEFTSNSNWFFPIMPGMPKATIGGIIACNGGGPLSLKFGKTSNYILGLEILFPTGEVVDFGGTISKNSEGIDFTKLFIGSEGTLGILTKVYLQCIPPLNELNYYRIGFENFENLLKTIPLLKKYDPYLIEAAEKNALKFSSNVNEHVIWVAIEKNQTLTLDPSLSITLHDKEIMKERFEIGHSLQKYKPFIDLDVSFPLLNSTNAILELQDFLNQHEFENIFFGHGGNGNWHIHLFFNDDKLKWEEHKYLFDGIIKKFEGAISGEHGIGRIHKDRFLRIEQDFKKNLYLSFKNQVDPFSQLPSLY